MTGRTPPSMPADEREIIASLVYAPAPTIALCLESAITPESFVQPECRIVYEEVLSAHAAGQQLSIDTLLHRVVPRISVNVLSDLTRDPPLEPTLRSSIGEVKKCHVRRDVIFGCARLSEAAFEDPDSMNERLARLLMTQARGVPQKTWARVVKDSVTQAEAVAAGTIEPEQRALPFPWEDCNSVFRRLRRKELVVLAARPSIGKSSFMRPICMHIAKLGYTTLIESLEVPAEDIAASSAATISGIGSNIFPTAHNSDKADYISGLKSLAIPTLHVFDRDRTLAAITARAKALHAQTPVDLIAIDYLGLIWDCSNTAKGENKAAAIGRVTKALKDLASDLDCVILCLAQLNRTSATEGNREPRLPDLRDSGDIEQDADRVIFIHRPEADPITRISQNDSERVQDRPRFFQNVIQAKGRNVGTGIVSFYFERATTRFMPIQRPNA